MPTSSRSPEPTTSTSAPSTRSTSSATKATSCSGHSRHAIIASVPSGFEGILSVGTVTTDADDADVQLYNAVLETYTDGHRGERADLVGLPDRPRLRPSADRRHRRRRRRIDLRRAGRHARARRATARRRDHLPVRQRARVVRPAICSLDVLRRVYDADGVPQDFSSSKCPPSPRPRLIEFSSDRGPSIRGPAPDLPAARAGERRGVRRPRADPGGHLPQQRRRELRHGHDVVARGVHLRLPPPGRAAPPPPVPAQDGRAARSPRVLAGGAALGGACARSSVCSSTWWCSDRPARHRRWRRRWRRSGSWSCSRGCSRSGSGRRACASIRSCPAGPGPSATCASPRTGS